MNLPNYDSFKLASPPRYEGPDDPAPEPDDDFDDSGINDDPDNTPIVGDDDQTEPLPDHTDLPGGES